jgi:hypothetical protein
MISSHSGFQPLKTVWLGDVYPESFYDSFDSELRDSLCQLTDTTKSDLLNVEKKLTELGVVVQRPEFTSVDVYMSNGKLTKPPICPRDWACVIGDTLYILPQYESGTQPWQKTLDKYIANNQKVKILNRFCDSPDPWCWVTFPSVVRVGKDVYVDYPKIESIESSVEAVCQELSKNYRVHITHTGDHSDGVFCPVAPGQIFSTHYRKTYSETFPNWDVFFLTDTTRLTNTSPGGKWNRNDHYLPYFSTGLMQYAANWIGNSKETVFEVNMLVVDEKNIICIAENDAACKRLETLGITPHVVNFKTRGFWDGGIHCITLDINRSGDCIDYWPDRGQNGIYRYSVPNV